jgi:hypothetical protein
VHDRTPAARPGGAPVIEADATRDDAQWWFTALDQRPLSVGAERWSAQVVGIHPDGADVWIQLHAVRDPLRDVTVRVQPGMSVDHVLAAIEAVIRDSAVR